MEKPTWIKEKGYLHLSPSLQLNSEWKRIVMKIQNPDYVASYAFYPLLHTFISDRKYKKGNSEKHTSANRSHTHYEIGTNKPVRNAKLRPLHYASHFDALIYGCYAEKIRELYEKELSKDVELNNAVIAYRKIETSIGSGKGKSNIHFAKECFDEIKKRAESEETAVLAIDLKSFFSSLDHTYLKTQWAGLLGEENLPKDHYNVFKSCTKFKYVLRDDLRVGPKSKNGRKMPFDESKLAGIRRNKGFRCFFESNEDFRKAITEGELSVYSNPFYRKVVNKDQSKFVERKINIGIPQGLPISAVLANLYLLEFDREMLEFAHNKLGGFYRRYSDDILVVCKKDDLESVETFAYELIEKFRIEISKEKTEKFIFKQSAYNNKQETRLTCFITEKDGNLKIAALSYLGFEFRGYHVGIKSTNLAKYYRKLKSVVRRKAKRALKLCDVHPEAKKAVFKNQVKKMYNLPVKFVDGDGLEEKKINRRRYRLVLNDRGFYEFKHLEIRNNKKQSNYHSYIKRCGDIFETDSFTRQVKKSKTMVFKAMNEYLN